MPTDDQSEELERPPIPVPGTPEYQEHFEHTGQASMDVTLSHPISRVVFGFLAIGFVCLWVKTVREAVTEYSFPWAILWIAGWTIIMVPIIRESAGIALLGKSRVVRYFGTMGGEHK